MEEEAKRDVQTSFEEVIAQF
jgi:hypothetical protein